MSLGKPGKIGDKLTCPKCKHLLNGFTGVNNEDRPKDGDVTVCIYCYAVCQYEKDLTNLRMLTQQELLELQKTHPDDFANIKEAIKQVYLINNRYG